jgi:ribosomal protein S18 acetylase RimI-like enzyme
MLRADGAQDLGLHGLRGAGVLLLRGRVAETTGMVRPVVRIDVDLVEMRHPCRLGCRRKREQEMAVLFVTEGLTVRSSEPSDMAALLSVYKQCEDFLSLGPVPTASMEMIVADIDHSTAAKGLFCVIENMEGETVGVLDFWPRAAPHVAVLSLLMISRGYRKKGYGRAIVNALESYLQAKHEVRTIAAGVQVNNPDAIRFWRSCGFQIGAAARLHEDGTTVHEMRKTIKPAM